MPPRVFLKRIAEAFATLLVSPLLALHACGLVAYPSLGQLLALVPGYAGILLRRAWYSRTLASCGQNLVVEFMSVIIRADTRLGDNCYINAFNWVGWADIGDDFIGGNHVTILSGAHQHGFARRDVPMRLQEGEKRQVKIGRDVWVGSHVLIAADVAEGSVLASGAVVVKPEAPYSILGGVPARVLKERP